MSEMPLSELCTLYNEVPAKLDDVPKEWMVG